MKGTWHAFDDMSLENLRCDVLGVSFDLAAISQNRCPKHILLFKPLVLVFLVNFFLIWKLYWVILFLCFVCLTLLKQSFCLCFVSIWIYVVLILKLHPIGKQKCSWKDYYRSLFLKSHFGISTGHLCPLSLSI